MNEKKFGDELDHPFDIEACYDAMLEKPYHESVCAL
jgi:hypothetical protein